MGSPIVFTVHRTADSSTQVNLLLCTARTYLQVSHETWRIGSKKRITYEPYEQIRRDAA